MSRPFSDWCDGLPERWRPRRLKYLTTCNDEVLSEDTPADLEIAYVDIGSVSSTGQIERIERLNFSGAPSRARRVVRHGDVLVSTVRTYLKAIAPVKRPPENMIASTGFAVIRCGEGTWPGYLAYALRTDGFVGHVIARSVGVSYPAINSSELGSLLIPAPPLDEQTQIAKFLDYETAKIDKLIDKQQQLIALLKEKRQAVISHAVTKGLNPDAPVKDSGVEWLGKVPAHWEVARLKFLVSAVVDCHHSTPRYDPDAPWPALRTSDIYPGRLDVAGAQRVHTVEYLQRISRLKPAMGDVIYAREGGRWGIAAPVPPGVDVCLAQRVMLCRGNDKMLSQLIMWGLNSSPVYNQLAVNVVGSASPHVNIADVLEVWMAVPPLADQSGLVEKLEDRLGTIDELEGRAALVIERLTERRSALISAAVTGKIDVRNWRPPETDAVQEGA